MSLTMKLESNVSKQNDNEKEEEESFNYAMQIAMSCVVPMGLKTTIELGVFDIIAKEGEGGKLSANDIADRIGTKNPEAAKMLDRLLGLMAAHSLIHCTEGVGPTWSHRLYSLAPASKFFTRDGDDMSLGPFVSLIHHNAFMKSWFHLKDVIVEGGRAFERANGMQQFEYFGKESELNRMFNRAMSQHSSIVMKKVLEHYKGFENLNTLVDVGGGIGFNLTLITSKYPNIKAINFDLPHVIQHALHYPGVEQLAGDMFESVPKADAIFMKWILHLWSDEKCLKLLKNCYDATPEDGKVIAVESAKWDMPDTSTSSKFKFQNDVFVMTQVPGGQERNQHEFMELAKHAGFKGVRFVCCVYNFWVIEFFK